MKNQIALKQQESPLSPALRDSDTGKMQLAELLAQCFNGLNVYGKDTTQLSDTVKLFIFALGKYPAASILPAFEVFLDRNSRMPTPADIASIIRRGNKPPLEQSVYVALCQKRERTSFKDAGSYGNCLTMEEEKYIAEYEHSAMGEKS